MPRYYSHSELKANGQSAPKGGRRVQVVSEERIQALVILGLMGQPFATADFANCFISVTIIGI
jgi:hypothetical protein